MMKKILILITALASIPVAFAQTGLFNSTGSNSFVTFGITILVVFMVIEAIRRQFKKNK